MKVSVLVLLASVWVGVAQEPPAKTEESSPEVTQPGETPEVAPVEPVSKVPS